MSNNPYQQIPASPLMGGKSHEDHARDKVRTPATLLMVSAIINSLVGIVVGVMLPVMFFGMKGELQKEMADDPDMTPELMEFVINLYGYGGIALAVFSLITGIIIVMAALRMLNLKSWGFALFAAILSMLPCVQSCWLLTLPVGIYVLVVLSDPQVKAAFAKS